MWMSRQVTKRKRDIAKQKQDKIPTWMSRQVKNDIEWKKTTKKIENMMSQVNKYSTLSELCDSLNVRHNMTI